MSRALLIALFFPPLSALRAAEKSHTLDLDRRPTLRTVYDASMTSRRVTDDKRMVGGMGALFPASSHQ